MSGELKELYKPAQVYIEENIADIVYSVPKESNPTPVAATQSAIQASLKNKIDTFLTEKNIEPLTLEESLEFDRQYDEMQAQLVATRKKYNDTVNYIDNILAKNGVSFHLNIDKKRRVKKALTRLFGSDSNIISYTQYKELLLAKAQLELAGMEDYKAGFNDE